MNKRSSELTQGLIGAHDQLLSPHFAGLRAALNDALAPNVTQAADLQQAEMSRRGNFSLVAGFIDTLPQAKVNGSWPGTSTFQVKPDDPYTAKQVQANTLWVTESPDVTRPNQGGPLKPHYIIGQREAEPDVSHGSDPATQLLLFGASASNRGITRLTVWNDQFAAAREKARGIGSSDYNYPEETLRRMFNDNTMQLEVSSGGCPMFTAPCDHSVHGRPFFNRNPAKRVEQHGLNAKMDTWKPENLRLEDADLAAFDVVSALSWLAVCFDKVSELQALCAKHGQNPATATDGE